MFLALHVGTTVVDKFVSIPLTAAFIPFTSSYKMVWLSLGAVALDLLIALVATSLIRNRLGAADLALGPLGRLHLLAGRAGARPGRGYRPEHPVGVRAHHRLRRGGRRGGHLALRRRGPGRCPVTSIALYAYRAPELRLPRLLAGVSYYHPTGLAEHEELYGPLPLPASRGAQPHQAAAARESDRPG